MEDRQRAVAVDLAYCVLERPLVGPLLAEQTDCLTYAGRRARERDAAEGTLHFHSIVKARDGEHAWTKPDPDHKR
jgi:hypothetical protein